jgi:Ran-binding protein 3
MASVDDNPGNDFSKKRAAARQISKDDDPDADDETPVDGASFKKAPDAILANRRIVKVRRTGGAAAPAPAHANPFASIRLVPAPPAETQLEVPSEVETHEDKGNGNSVPVPGEDSKQSVGEPATESVLETATKDGLTDSVTAAGSTEVSTDTAVNGEKVVISSDVNDGASEKATDSVNNGEKAAISSDVHDGASEKVSVGPSGLSADTFQQLSSAKNAFSGSFGTGFSAASSTAGSTQVASSTGFGSLTGGFSFGSGPTFGTSLIGSGSGKSASPFQGSVFGKSNGNSTFQLFGPGAAAATLPASGLPSSGLPTSTGITLQEVHVESGEEKERTVFAADASLFEFLDGGWNERGKGEVKINVPEDASRRPRLVMRSKGNLRLLLNANIVPDMKITKMDNRGVTFVCANAIGDGKVGLATYALKLRDAQIARDFLSTVESKKGAVTSAEPRGEPRTPETSPKAVDRPSEVSDEVSKDVEATG